jgi:rubredoxin
MVQDTAVRSQTLDTLPAASQMKVYLCLICGFVYDEAAGMPEEGIAPGTRWEDIPTTWRCPDCGVGKEDFEMMEI